MLALFGIDDPDVNTVVVAVITAFVTAVLTSLIRERGRVWAEPEIYRRNADAAYEFEQRKKLRDTIGSYHGRLLEASTDFNYRLVNLGTNHDKGWLDVAGQYKAAPGTQYYFRTTVYRFLVLASLINRFEREALVIDARIAGPNDLTFLLYVKTLRWVLTDAALFRGVVPPYDGSLSTDHFFTDRLRQMSAATAAQDLDLTLTRFEEMLEEPEQFQDALAFFDGMRPGLLRWDRLMSLRLILMSFVNTFGHDFQRSGPEWFDRVASEIQRPQVVENLLFWIPKLGLEEDLGMVQAIDALRRRLADPGRDDDGKTDRS